MILSGPSASREFDCLRAAPMALGVGMGIPDLNSAVPTGPSPPISNGLVSWVRADWNITLNGSNVSAWGDLSGNNRGWSQGNASFQPAYHANGGANNLPYLSFTHASGLFLAASSSSSASANTGWAVIRPVWPGSGATWTLLYLPNPTTLPAIESNAINTISTKVQMSVLDGSTTQAQINFTQGVDAALSYDTAAPTFSSIWNDHGTPGSNSNDAAQNPAVYSSTALLGADAATGTDSWNGFVYEVMLFNRDLSNTELATLETYGNGRYGT